MLDPFRPWYIIQLFNGSAGNKSKIVAEVMEKTKVFYCPRLKIEVNRTLYLFIFCNFHFFTDITDNTEPLHNKPKYTGKL